MNITTWADSSGLYKKVKVTVTSFGTIPNINKNHLPKNFPNMKQQHYSPQTYNQPDTTISFHLGSTTYNLTLSTSIAQHQHS
jgi:hypothetical protein